MSHLLFALLRRCVCPWCFRGFGFHTNAMASIGGSEGRHPVYDLHQVTDHSGVGLRECYAYGLRIRLTGDR